MKLAVFSTKPYDKDYFEMYRAGYEVDFTFYEAALDATTANLTEGFDAVCVFVNDIIDEKTIEIMAFHGIQLIALRCAGYNNVALDSAKNHSIKVVRVPAYSPDAVAEHAVALILTLNRKTHKAYNRVRESNFSLNNLIGFNLHGKTVGIIGTGKIGATFCKVIQGFGCKVVAHDTYESEDLKTTGVTYKTLEEVFNDADIISLHCPLLPETKHLINKNTLEQMKDGVMIINTSRGALINTADAIAALSQRKIGYLGIDVYEQEENIFFKDLSESIIQDDMILRLMSFPNVLITSHQAFFTKEAMKEITITTLENLKEFIQGKELTNQVFE